MVCLFDPSWFVFKICFESDSICSLGPWSEILFSFNCLRSNSTLSCDTDSDSHQLRPQTISDLTRLTQSKVYLPLTPCLLFPLLLLASIITWAKFFILIGARTTFLDHISDLQNEVSAGHLLFAREIVSPYFVQMFCGLLVHFELSTNLIDDYCPSFSVFYGAFLAFSCLLHAFQEKINQGEDREDVLRRGAGINPLSPLFRPFQFPFACPCFLIWRDVYPHMMYLVLRINHPNFSQSRRRFSLFESPKPYEDQSRVRLRSD